MLLPVPSLLRNQPVSRAVNRPHDLPMLRPANLLQVLLGYHLTNLHRLQLTRQVCRAQLPPPNQPCYRQDSQLDSLRAIQLVSQLSFPLFAPRINQPVDLLYNRHLNQHRSHLFQPLSRLELRRPTPCPLRIPRLPVQQINQLPFLLLNPLQPLLILHLSHHLSHPHSQPVNPPHSPLLNRSPILRQCPLRSLARFLRDYRLRNPPLFRQESPLRHRLGCLVGNHRLSLRRSPRLDPQDNLRRYRVVFLVHSRPASLLFRPHSLLMSRLLNLPHNLLVVQQDSPRSCPLATQPHNHQVCRQLSLL